MFEIAIDFEKITHKLLAQNSFLDILSFVLHIQQSECFFTEDPEAFRNLNEHSKF